MKYRLGDLIDVSSDGWDEDWLFGVNFARQVLKLAIPIPSSIETKPNIADQLIPVSRKGKLKLVKGGV